jgi:hypothetical protein
LNRRDATSEARRHAAISRIFRVRRIVTDAIGLGFLSLLVCLSLSAIQAFADPFFNSSEPGCDGSDPTVLWCDDFEDGDWAQIYGSGGSNPEVNDGWVMTPWGQGCPRRGCQAGEPLQGLPKFGVLCGGAGAAGTNCTASSGLRPNQSEGQALFMGDHDLKGATHEFDGYREIYFRYYLKDLPGFQVGQEKMLSINPCCAGRGGIKFGNTFSWKRNGSRNVQVTVYAADVNLGEELNITLPAGSWWFIEYHIKLNTPGSSDGVWEAWVDTCGVAGTSCTGTPTRRARYTNVKWVREGDRTTIGSLWLENWANPPSRGETYYDQIKVSTVGPIGFSSQPN